VNKRRALGGLLSPINNWKEEGIERFGRKSFQNKALRPMEPTREIEQTRFALQKKEYGGGGRLLKVPPGTPLKGGSHGNW